MKFSLIIILITVTQLSFAGLGKIEEEVYIPKTTKTNFELILSHPELSIDHMNSDGFELYGPKGMMVWLKDAGIDFSLAHKELHSHSKSASDFLNYPSFKQIEANLKSMVAKNPKIAKLFSIGKSVKGRELYVVKISDNVNIDELEPEFKYISSMHGDEITGRELTQFLIKDLIEGYNINPKITKLINNTEIFIMVSMNPDGSDRKSRANASGYDLNRNFPDWTRGDVNSLQKRQPETKSIMKFQAERQFSLSANFHGGAVVANYPWDATYDRHPFDGLVKDLSLKYAALNPEMRSSREFSGGVTNGADWYVLHGGMQDWSYFWHNDLQITIELSDKKWPRYKEIPGFYKDNKESMIAYAESIHQGAGFKLVDSTKDGKVVISKLNADGTTTAKGSYGFNSGEFYKVLPVGSYIYKIRTEGSTTVEQVQVSVDELVNRNGNYYRINL